MKLSPLPDTDYDVAILGGSFSGACAGYLLKRDHPELRVLIVEKAAEFDRKVGESTSEVSGCFLTRVLGLHRYLSQNHITKHGLRLWFNGGGNECMSRCAEIGSKFQVRLPTYQLDRSHLDPHLLAMAEAAGCEVARPAAARDIELGGAGKNRLTIKSADGERRITAGWIIDASGKAAVIARQTGHWRRLDDHPTNSLWARFRGTADIDDAMFRSKMGECFREAVWAGRGTATNHLMGRGWWCWIIPLKDGDVSAGVTWDPRIFQLPAGGSLGERLKAHLVSHPVGREMFGNAEPVEKDVRTYSHLPYYSERAAGDGWVLVGDAAGFMDPLYSQGLDYCSHSIVAGVRTVSRAMMGGCPLAAGERFNQEFRESYFRWFNAIYRNKYEYLGDAELMFAAFLMDVGTYFVGPVRLVYELGEDEFERMPYNGPAGAAFAKFMAFYNRRLVAIAKKRLAAGCYGRRNTDRRFIVSRSFSADFSAFRLVRDGAMQWLKAELHALFLPSAQRAAATPSPQPAEVMKPESVGV